MGLSVLFLLFFFSRNQDQHAFIHGRMHIDTHLTHMQGGEREVEREKRRRERERETEGEISIMAH